MTSARTNGSTIRNRPNDCSSGVPPRLPSGAGSRLTAKYTGRPSIAAPSIRTGSPSSLRPSHPTCSVANPGGASGSSRSSSRSSIPARVRTRCQGSASMTWATAPSATTPAPARNNTNRPFRSSRTRRSPFGPTEVANDADAPGRRTFSMNPGRRRGMAWRYQKRIERCSSGAVGSCRKPVLASQSEGS